MVDEDRRVKENVWSMEIGLGYQQKGKMEGEGCKRKRNKDKDKAEE